MLAWIRRRWHDYQARRELARLCAQARSPDPAAREQGAGLLGQRPEEQAAQALIPLLQDAHTGVRTAARSALLQQGASALNPLLAGLNHPNPDVARVAAELLGELNRPEAVEPLLQTLKYAPRPVQLAARRALERLGPLALDRLRAAGDEPQPWVRQQIAEIVARITAGDGSAVTS
jgi:HEAT repeat protein